ncbi:metallophosphoesterase family protein [Planococcus shenhongbingii]|uniref:Metallophosphoesterase family protein n=1 Tax=Planococcus shenhongbingii TaxID=3058398 RepID=A0ABT8NDQ0_9BACL|nr:metallophosphoesterase family protein [Planococcus sp. N017]MDN7245645.1 metallophosphoesterase family protein [Planococcus sp. N017]
MSTKIAVIADVHGNSTALLAALNEIDKDHEIHHIYCIGDMVGIGYETNKVLEILFSRDDVSFVMGNHEEEILAILEGEESSSQEGEKIHHEWLANRLEKRFIPHISGMPKQLSGVYEGKKLLFTHYHLDAEKQFIPIDTEPSIEKLDDFYKQSPFDLVCFGHHHPKHYFSSEERIYLNPGSLGCYDKPFARYATILITTDDIKVELEEAAYNNQDFLKGYEVLEVPEKDFILNTFHGNQHQN